jgi:hypothetical protein
MCRQPTIRAPVKGPGRAELLAQGHQPRHLGLGDRYFASAPIGERDVAGALFELADDN